MKNIQVIDGAMNSAYSIFAVSDKTFKAIFPCNGQDIEFAEDFIRRVGMNEYRKLMTPVWKRLLRKPQVTGIHGTLFFGLGIKKLFYPAKRESDLARRNSAANDDEIGKKIVAHLAKTGESKKSGKGR